MAAHSNPGRTDVQDKGTVRPRLLSEREAAHYIGMSQRFLRKGRYQPGQGTPVPPHVQVGRTIRFDVNDLDVWIERFKVNRIEDYRG